MEDHATQVPHGNTAQLEDQTDSPKPVIDEAKVVGAERLKK